MSLRYEPSSELTSHSPGCLLPQVLNYLSKHHEFDKTAATQASPPPPLHPKLET